MATPTHPNTHDARAPRALGFSPHNPHRCVKLGLTCENPRANPEEERLARRLTVRHGWGRVLGDPAQMTAEQRVEVTRFRPQNINRDKAKIVLYVAS